MLPSLTPTRCRAKKRAQCRFHGAEDRALSAIKRSSITAYFDAMSELEALRSSNWDESGWGFIRPENREIESHADIEGLLASKQVLADEYRANFEYGSAMRPGIVRRSAKTAKIQFAETRTDAGVVFEFIAKSKQDLRFLKKLLEHNARMLAEDDEQFATVNLAKGF